MHPSLGKQGSPFPLTNLSFSITKTLGSWEYNTFFLSYKTDLQSLSSGKKKKNNHTDTTTQLYLLWKEVNVNFWADFAAIPALVPVSPTKVVGLAGIQATLDWVTRNFPAIPATETTFWNSFTLKELPWPVFRQCPSILMELSNAFTEITDCSVIA